MVWERLQVKAKTPYISSYGQKWADVVIFHLVAPTAEVFDTVIGKCTSWTSFFRHQFTNDDLNINIHNASEDQQNAIPFIEAKAVYFKTFCTSNVVSNATTPSPKKKQRFVNLGGIEKCVGAHAPASRWITDTFPEFHQVDDYRQVRISDDEAFNRDIITHHDHDCPLLFRHKCLLKNSCSEPIQGLTFNLFIRVHLHPKRFVYPISSIRPLGITPGEPMFLVPTSKIAPVDRDAPPTSYIALFYKPPGLPSEAHVSNALDCLHGRIDRMVTEILPVNSCQYQAHAFNRLDTWVAGVIAIYLRPRDTPKKSKNRMTCSLIRKEYEGLAVYDDSLSQLNLGSWNNIQRFMPPSNIFDRSAPLPCSKIQIPGWKECIMDMMYTEIISDPLDYFKILFAKTDTNTQECDLGLQGSWSTEIIREIERIVNSGKRLVKFCVKLKTGRRHQIRALMAALGSPIALDRQYDVLCDYSVSPEEILISNNFHRQERERQIANREERTDDPDKVSGVNASEKPKLLTLMDQSLPLQMPIALTAVMSSIRLENGEEYSLIKRIRPWWENGTFNGD